MGDAALRLRELENQRRMEMNDLLDEQLQVHGSDSPGMQLVTMLLNNSNFLIWRSAMLSALEAKMKVGFVDGSLAKPEIGTPMYMKWKRANSLVCSWLRSSMILDLAKNYMFVHDAQDLWDSLEQRLGTSTLPHLFEIKRGISILRQGNMTVSDYFGRLKELWDQYDQLRVIPHVAGDVGDLLKRLKNEDRVMEFLMGLNDVYDVERSQIIYIEPLPQLDKTYNMIVTAEKHREVSTRIAIGTDGLNSAMMAKGMTWKKDGIVKPKTGFQKDDKRNLKCSHCTKPGHTVETCFQLKGYPEWWDELMKKKGKPYHAAHHVDVGEFTGTSDTPLDQVNGGTESIYEAIGNMQKDIQRLYKGKAPAGP